MVRKNSQKGKIMDFVYKGKTKDVYRLENGNYRLFFKDDVTGVDGVFDPGANTVGLSIDGMGLGGLRLTTHYFELLKKHGILTHYVQTDLANRSLEVLPATVFGHGLEVICRFKAVGSFLRRYGKYVKEGQALEAFVEVTLKDDEREDPPISQEALAMLGILSKEEYESLVQQTREISLLVKEDLKAYGCELFDIKLEFGRAGNKVILIDEISGGNMRVYKDGRILEPLELVDIVVGA